ncbi:hypothetical protein [Dyella acidisoli]|uniref:Uncharacterized protein n=1 Tax=Dyella acidisoli TaxID=1867834 RepID=A0ABQ5XS84_9GAMM|nr:hypothetical protein [Dyella acidisoli]GLQ94619.1 hypothetical protein GCM10007901_35710 [Dyella acidisoli]
MLNNEEQLIAPYLVLLLGRLTGWNYPHGDGGDPVYLTGEQKAALAVEGINLLSSYLPADAARQVTSAIERLPRPEHIKRNHADHEAALMRIGALGGVLHVTHSSGSPPGCCVMENGHLVCVN